MTTFAKKIKPLPLGGGWFVLSEDKAVVSVSVLSEDRGSVSTTT